MYLLRLSKVQRHAPNDRKCSKFTRYLLLVVFVLIFTLPDATHEFGFSFGGDDNNGTNAKQIARRRSAEKKFKFRKIERVYVDPDNGADASDEAAVASSRRNEDEEFIFESGRKSQKDRQEEAEKSARKSSHENSGEGFMGVLFSGWFGSRKKSIKDEPSPTNGIIDWLKWLGEQVSQSKSPPTEPAVSIGSGWMSYLNRWPFNTFFPTGKPKKPIYMSRSSTQARYGTLGDAQAEAAPLSQEHFESLLHTLPGFVVNGSVVADVDCKQQLQIFYRQLRGNKLWTLQMLDATGKISSGVLRGNINQFGDFNLCTQVKTVVRITPKIPVRIRGKYCLAHIETQTQLPELKVALHFAHGRGLWKGHLGNPSHFVPRYTVANWGICIPHLCPAKVVQTMIETNLRRYNTTGVEFTVEVDDNDCFTQQRTKFMRLLKKDSHFTIAIVYIASLVLLMLVSVVLEYWLRIWENTCKAYIFIKLKFFQKNDATEESTSEENAENSTANNLEQPEVSEKIENNSATTIEEASPPSSEKFLLKEIIKSFSPERTLSALLSQQRPDVQFPIVHVLKLGAMFMLYICLKYLMIGHLPITNRDQLVDSVDQSFSIFFRAPMIYTDILLVISGFLSAYQLSQEMQQKSYIQLLKRIAAKVARYLPTLYVVLLFQTHILPQLQSGPLWSNLIGENTRLCSQQMWRNFFSVQNAIDFEETCSPMTVQLALEVQLYLLAPLIVWLYYTDSDAGFFAYGAIHVMSVAARFSRTNREHLSATLFHGINVSKFYRTANMLYASPISRATPYLLGIGAGILHRTQNGVLEVSPQLMPFGWGLSALTIVWCFWSQVDGMRTDYIYTPSDAASYAAWYPLVLGLALLWIIMNFPRQENSPVVFVINSRLVLYLSRIAYPMQLVMYVVVLHNTAKVKESLKYQITDLLNPSEIGAIIFFASILAFVIDVPSQKVRNLIINRIFIERPHQELDPLSGNEQSEGEADPSEEHSEPITSDTSEPPEGIRASGSDEEEPNYIADLDSVEKEDYARVEVTESETKNEDAEEVEEEEVEEEEDNTEDITEADEVVKRPTTPPSSVTPRRRPTTYN